MNSIAVKRALLSVSDKSGLLPLAQALSALDVQLMSTGGTRKLLEENGLQVTDIADYTGFPEMMDGRVKTLHPRVHGGLLGRRQLLSGAGEYSGPDAAVMQEQGIASIDLLVVNLYPFEDAVDRDPNNLAQALENIDIGGPAMLRSAAKNYACVCVLVDTDDYAPLAAELAQNAGHLSLETRFRLAIKAFERVAEYDAAIANYLSGYDLGRGERQAYPSSLTLQFRQKQLLRYGENPHQSAAFYVEPGLPGMSVAHAEQLQGKEMSFNNIADTDAALACVQSFNAPACVIVKHGNPCGVAEAQTLQEAYQRALAADPVSAFGGILAFNRQLEEALAKEIIERFVEVIITTEVTEAAQLVFSAKRDLRLLVTSPAEIAGAAPMHDYKWVAGGLLVQSRDAELLIDEQLKVVTQRRPTEEEQADLLFAWTVAKFVKSNAIVYARNKRTIGIGAGQMSRVDSAKIALLKAAAAELLVAGSVMASDAFFPFRDGIDAAAEAGVTAVIQPGGSKRDEEVLQAANEAEMAMIFTGMRHFRH